MGHVKLPASFLLHLTLWMAAAALFPGSGKGEDAAWPLHQCDGQVAELIVHCGLFIKKWPKDHIPPPVTCCLAVRHLDMKCVCEHFPPEMEKFYSCEKIVYVAQYCKNPVPPPSKCGKYTVPKA